MIIQKNEQSAWLYIPFYPAQFTNSVGPYATQSQGASLYITRVKEKKDTPITQNYNYILLIKIEAATSTAAEQCVLTSKKLEF